MIDWTESTLFVNDPEKNNVLPPTGILIRIQLLWESPKVVRIKEVNRKRCILMDGVIIDWFWWQEIPKNEMMAFL